MLQYWQHLDTVEEETSKRTVQRDYIQKLIRVNQVVPSIQPRVLVLLRERVNRAKTGCYFGFQPQATGAIKLKHPGSHNIPISAKEKDNGVSVLEYQQI